MIVFDHDLCPTMIFLLGEVLRFALGVQIYVHNRHLYVSDVEGHSYMSRLSKHYMCLLQLVAKRSFQVPLLNSRFFQESIKVNHTRVYSRILPEVCADVMTTGLPDAYKKLICIVQRVHFQVRVGVFNCQQILIKFSFVIFCGEMCNNFYQNATNIMCVSST